MKHKAVLLLILSGCSSIQTPPFVSQARSSKSPDSHFENTLTTSHPTTEKAGILLSWPLHGTIDMTRGFMTGLVTHQGLDLAAPKGTPVYAAHAGFVEYVGHDFSGYGNLVIINSGAMWSTFYAHLSKYSVREKQMIKRGQIIGKVGATGNAHGVHLHFELRYGETPVDPIAYLP